MKTLEELESYIKEGEVLKVRISDKLNNLENQYKQIAEELLKLGINPETASEDIAKKEKEYTEALQKLEQMLPTDIIDKYKNYDFSGNNSTGTVTPF